MAPIDNPPQAVIQARLGSSVHASAAVNARRETRMPWTEHLMAAAVASAFLLAAAKPLFDLLLNISAFKHVPALLFAGAIALHLIGMHLYPRKQQSCAPLRPSWPFIVLGLFALTGSLVGRFWYGVQDGFLVLGLYVNLVWLGALALNHSSPGRLMRSLMAWWGFFFVATLCGGVLRFGTHDPLHDPLHELEFLIYPYCVFLWFSTARPLRRTCIAGLVLIVTVLDIKNTAFILASLTLLYFAWFALRSRMKSAVRATALVLVVATAAGASGYEYRHHMGQAAPSGSPEVRLKQYDAAWKTFLASPLLGRAYLGSSGEDAWSASNKYISRHSIPTHSDILDFLKNGGCLAFFLWAYGLVRILTKLVRHPGFLDPDSALFPLLQTLACFLIASVVTYAFNPILLQPIYAFLYWFIVGVAYYYGQSRAGHEA